MGCEPLHLGGGCWHALKTVGSVAGSREDRGEREAAAILHFLEARNGVDFFFFRVPSPYDTLVKFICREFTSTIVFKNAINIKSNQLKQNQIK